ncbi:MAG TPA: hypothetical protein VFJ94_13655 [Intrasporangium sp.]|uniref:hypothetical protein n=1 Tax=Intrasporangium sp. TaxID=1925024 RepID=UPI002D7690E8|nr:hypothetical protein [Intrasporangium sp.]HET7399557.1 hypothetical protein [Intrasporangium sp.]
MTRSKAADRGRPHVAFSVILRGALPPAAVAGVLSAVVLAVTGGVGAGLAGLAGVAIALAFFTSGLVAVSRIVVDTGNPMLFMAVGMTVYLAQIIALFLVLLVARGIDGFDSRSAGIAMLVTVLVWQAAQIRAWRHARVPVYDGTPGGPEAAP